MVKSAIRDVWDEGKARMVGAASYWEVAGKSHKRMIGKLRLYGLCRKSQRSLPRSRGQALRDTMGQGNG
jgi:PIN domain nuclease of toxin-antitoxin system